MVGLIVGLTVLLLVLVLLIVIGGGAIFFFASAAFESLSFANTKTAHAPAITAANPTATKATAFVFFSSISQVGMKRVMSVASGFKAFSSSMLATWSPTSRLSASFMS